MLLQKFDPPFEYFPLTPDEELDNMAALAPINNHLHNGTNGAYRGKSPSRAGAPAKVTLSLGHLPSKQEPKGNYPRTPSRVCFSLLQTC